MRIEHKGSIVLFVIENEKEYKWITNNVESEPWQWQNRTLSVDSRYSKELLKMIKRKGFKITNV